MNVDQDSSLASLGTTNNALREVILWANSDVTADITIGNSVTDGAVPNMPNNYMVSLEESIAYDSNYCGCLYPDNNPCDVTDNRNNALRDVQLFTAAGAQGKAALNSNVDVTLYASLTDAFTGKYLNLMDSAVNPRADNVVATYLFAGGNDHLNMNISKANFAFAGAATREDFAFYTDTGAGNDIVELQIGDGQFGYAHGSNDTVADGSIEELAQVFDNSANWYTNHLLNDNLAIVTGNGNDFVNTWGSTAATIHLGAGDDIVYTDNSGSGSSCLKSGEASPGGGTGFNCDRAVWVFNAQSDKGEPPQVNDLLSFGRANVDNVANLSIVIHYQDLSVQWEVGGSWGSVNGVTVTDLTINQAIKAAVNGHPALSAFLVAMDGPSGTLLVLSKVDGEHVRTDFSVTLAQQFGIDGKLVPLTAAQQAPGALGILLPALNTAALQNLGWNPSFVAPSGLVFSTPYGDNDGLAPGDGFRWDSEFGFDGGNRLTGVDSVNVNNNRVWGSTGSDKIALSSNATSIEHVIIKKVGTEVFASQAAPDYIMNFTAAIVDQRVRAVAEVQKIAFTYDVDQGGVPGDVAEANFTAVITLGDGQVVNVPITSGMTAQLINAAVAAAIDPLSNVAAVVNDNGTPANFSDDFVTVTYASGTDYPNASVLIKPTNPTEVQTLTVTGAPNPAGATMQVSVSFAGHLILTDVMASDASDNTIAAEIEEAFDEAGFADVRADLSGNIVTLNYFGGTDPAEAGSAVAVSAGNNLVDISVTTTNAFLAFNPGVFASPTVEVTRGAPEFNPALGYDIFDVTDVLGFAPYYFNNTKQDNSNSAEYNAVNALVDNGRNGIAIIDTLDGNGAPNTEFAYTGSPTTELARLQQMVTAGDGDAEAKAFTHIIITVRNDGTTDTSVAGNPAGNGFTANWYQVDDAVGVNNATVTYMGTMKLLGYDSTALNKDPIGDWDAMTLANFTYQTPANLMDTYLGGIV